MTYDQNRSHRGLASRRLLTVAVIVAAGALVAVPLLRRLRPTPVNNAPVFITAHGPLEISVTEAGTLHPSEQIILKSQLEGRSTILFLVPEGSQVKTGDLLVELDATDLEDRRIEQAIRAENAEAAFIRSRENLEVVGNQARSDVEKAELTLQFAIEDLEHYKAGQYPNREKELEARITLAREEQQRAEEKLKWSQVLFDEKYLSESEIQADELSVRKAALDVELAENNLALLQDFEYKREITKRESDVRQAKMALERAIGKARADNIQAEADLRAKESEFTQHTTRLEKLVEQISRAKIVAPRDGLVVYATSTQFQWRGNVEPLSEGQEVRERQELIYLPTASSFISRIKIHESSLQKISRGMPVALRVDALPDQTFTGTVSTIAPLPDPVSTFMNPDLKLYDTEIRIDGESEVLRTGMSCEVTIHIASYEDAVHVPVHCVVRIGREPFVFVRRGDGFEPQPVTLGMHNNRMIHILSGLEPGTPVMLAPPLDSTPAVAGDMETPEPPALDNSGESAEPAVTAPEKRHRGPNAPGGASPDRSRRPQEST